MKKTIAVGKWDIRSLGEGAFGEVFYCKNRYTGQEIATKRLKTNHLLKPDEIEVMKRRWRQEYDWLQSLEKTPFIVDAVKIHDSDFMDYLKKQNESVDLPIIIMEYCNGGDLREHLQKVDNFNGLQEFEVRCILFSIRHAIEYLHEKCNIEHRDIKPENIVIKKIENDKKIFKLTDFGYAKDIPDSTVAQSVVGTRHYVAPEVVDPGNYTQTVDYWSIGVMAFEIICGIQPFIPHQNFKNIMTNIYQKPNDCIAITQVIDEPITDRFQFHKNIYKENHLSDFFVSRIENWLQLSLDKNYRTRGYRNNQLKFYTDLDNILQTKILTVFCLKNYKIYYYEIEKFVEMGDFLRTLQKDTKTVSLKNICCILPTGHPKHRLINIRNPIDFFVPDWCDTSNLDNPHVMLYIADITQCDFNAKLEDIHINATIKKMMNKDAHEFMAKYNKNNELNWLLKQFERYVHFVISKQQYLAECYVQGLYEFILGVEDVVFKYQPLLSKIYDDSLILSGRVQQFADTVQHYAKTNTKEVNKWFKTLMVTVSIGIIMVSWLNKAEEHSKECHKLRDDIVKKVKIRFKSVLNHCKDLASHDIYKTFPHSDVFKLQEYRKFLILQHQPVERMEKCQQVFESFVQHGFESFIANSELKCIRESIQKQHNIFSKICDLVKDIQERVEKMSNKLNQDTENLMLTVSSVNADPTLALKMNSLSIDGTPASLSHVFMNGHYSLGNGEAFDASTAQVLEESKSLLSLLNASMEIDEDISMREDLPTTIQNI